MTTLPTYLRPFAAVLALASAAGCASAPRPGGCLYTQETDFYFGRALASGGSVTDADWDAFVREAVTARYPGFTVYDAAGHWKGAREETRVLAVLHRGTAEDDSRLAAIAAEYRRRFGQQAVLRADLGACGRLVGEK